MKASHFRLMVIGFALHSMALAQLPVTPNLNHESLLKDSNKTLAKNKRLVYDFWREVLEAGHLELASKFMRESYIQHNPNVPTGRKGFIDFFSRFGAPRPIQPKIQRPLVAILADKDLVILAFVKSIDDPKDAARSFTTTEFDMFRIEGGKIAEHWDTARK